MLLLSSWGILKFASLVKHPVCLHITIWVQKSEMIFLCGAKSSTECKGNQKLGNAQDLQKKSRKLDVLKKLKSKQHYKTSQIQRRVKSLFHRKHIRTHRFDMEKIFEKLSQGIASKVQIGLSGASPEIESNRKLPQAAWKIE